MNKSQRQTIPEKMLIVMIPMKKYNVLNSDNAEWFLTITEHGYRMVSEVILLVTQAQLQHPQACPLSPSLPLHLGCFPGHKNCSIK